LYLTNVEQQLTLLCHCVGAAARSTGQCVQNSTRNLVS